MSKYNFDRNFFQEPCFTNIYWSGFIAADGNVAANRNTISIDLAIKDREHLEKFRSDVRGNFRIEDRDRGSKGIQSRIRVDCAEWKKDLRNNFNITPQKTFTLDHPDLNTFQSMCFIAGYIDGDGSISNGYVKVVGTERLLIWIKHQFDLLYPSDTSRQCNIRAVSHSPVYELTVGGHRAKRFVRIIKSCPLPILNRKWNSVS